MWVVTLVICISSSSSTSTSNNDGDTSDADDLDLATMTTTTPSTTNLPYPLAPFAWSFGQCIALFLPEMSKLLTSTAWKAFELHHQHPQQQQQQQQRQQNEQRHLDLKEPPSGTNHTSSPSKPSKNFVEEIQTIDMQRFRDDPQSALLHLKSRYGSDWRERPLLLRNLWSDEDLSSSSRRLSLKGMTTSMDWTIPYFTDATIPGALEPDHERPVHEIVSEIQAGKPYKIGSQFIIQHDPTLMDEVAPYDIVTPLFGNHFSKDQLLGHGKTLGVFPGLTTVPVFVANTAIKKTNDGQQKEEDGGRDQTCFQSDDDGSTRKSIEEQMKKMKESDHPVTGLHCEPIANIAVQLAGYRQWTLVDPRYSWRLRPAISADGRSFYPSWITTDQLKTIPRYEVMTSPGDALFVPTWTWHRVDYRTDLSEAEAAAAAAVKTDDKFIGRMKELSNNNANGDGNNVSIGASLFHFRAGDYVRRNPLFALLLVPAIIKEAIGVSSQ